MECWIVSAWYDDAQKCGRISLQIAGQIKAITVTRRSLLSMASPPRSNEARLFQFLESFCEIALAYATCEPAHSETLIVTANNVRGWRRGRLQAEPLWTWYGSTGQPQMFTAEAVRLQGHVLRLNRSSASCVHNVRRRSSS